MTKKLSCIMLVDDDEDDNFFHESEISEQDPDLAVIVRDSGSKALEYLKSGERPCPQLIFLDINMPRMTGWEFLTKYNQLEKQIQNDNIIVMLSTSYNHEDISRAKTWDSVSDYITKPLTKEILETIIEKYFSKQPPKI